MFYMAFIISTEVKTISLNKINLSDLNLDAEQILCLQISDAVLLKEEKETAWSEGHK